MKIAQILELDVGMKGITCQGAVTWSNKPKNITGTSNGKDYSFWSQFIVVEDNTGKIGVSITVEEDQRSVTKGDEVTVEKAELKEYTNNDGDKCLKLQGKLYSKGRQDAQQCTQQATQRPKAPQVGNNDIEVRKCVVCAYLAGGTRPLSEDVDYWIKYIETGIDASLPENVNTGDADGRPATDDDVPY